MEMNEALGRIVVRHVRILLVCAVIGTLGALGLAAAQTPTYEATARLALGGWDPNDATKAKTLADSARAIATSDKAVAAAIQAVGAERAAKAVVRNTSVTAVGSSSVVDLAVRDTDPKVAAAIANALTTSLIEVRIDLLRGQVEALVADLDKRIAAQDERVKALETAARAAPSRTQQAELLLQQYAAAVGQRADLDAERRSLRAIGAGQPRAAVIDAATAPAKPLGSDRTMGIALGFVGGLLLGLLAASLVELLRPTVTGPVAIAREAGGPWLGTLPTRGPGADGHVEAAAGGIRLAAASAKVGTVVLVEAGDVGDGPERLARGIPSESQRAPIERGVGSMPDAWRVRLTTGRSDRFGVVLVAAHTIRRDDLVALHHLMAATGWPLLGLVLVRRAARKPVLGRFGVPVHVTTIDLKDGVDRPGDGPAQEPPEGTGVPAFGPVHVATGEAAREEARSTSAAARTFAARPTSVFGPLAARLRRPPAS